METIEFPWYKAVPVGTPWVRHRGVFDYDIFVVRGWRHDPVEDEIVISCRVVARGCPAWDVLDLDLPFSKGQVADILRTAADQLHDEEIRYLLDRLDADHGGSSHS